MMRSHNTENRPVIIAAKTHAVLTDRLALAGYELWYILPEDPAWAEAIHRAVGLVMASGLRIDEAFLSHAPALRWIARLGSGMELVDIPAAERRDIKVVSSPEGKVDALRFSSRAPQVQAAAKKPALPDDALPKAVASIEKKATTVANILSKYTVTDEQRKALEDAAKDI